MTDMLTVLADKKQTNNLEELKKYIDEGNNGISVLYKFKFKL